MPVKKRILSVLIFITVLIPMIKPSLLVDVASLKGCGKLH